MSGGQLIAAVAPSDYVTIKLAEIVTGLSEKAMRRKIEDGKWIEGQQYRYSPDGGLFISLPGYYKWVESGNGSRRSRNLMRKNGETAHMGADCTKYRALAE